MREGEKDMMNKAEEAEFFRPNSSYDREFSEEIISPAASAVARSRTEMAGDIGSWKGVGWRAPLNAMRSFRGDFPKEFALNKDQTLGEGQSPQRKRKKKGDYSREADVSSNKKKRKVGVANTAAADGSDGNDSKTILPVRLEPLPLLQEIFRLKIRSKRSYSEFKCIDQRCSMRVRQMMQWLQI